MHEFERPDGSIAKTEDEIKTESENFFAEFLKVKPDDFVGTSVESLTELLGFQCSEGDCL